jgi:hypothetical protein
MRFIPASYHDNHAGPWSGMIGWFIAPFSSNSMRTGCIWPLTFLNSKYRGVPQIRQTCTAMDLCVGRKWNCLGLQVPPFWQSGFLGVVHPTLSPIWLGLGQLTVTINDTKHFESQIVRPARQIHLTRLYSFFSLLLHPRTGAWKGKPRLFRVIVKNKMV